jgi:hypothetical protein
MVSRGAQYSEPSYWQTGNDSRRGTGPLVSDTGSNPMGDNLNGPAGPAFFVANS